MAICFCKHICTSLEGYEKGYYAFEATGKHYCSICEYKIYTDSYYCPCCNNRYRTKSRNRQIINGLGVKGVNSGSKNGMYGKCTELNPNWKYDNVGLYGLHKWVRKHFQPTMLCQMCMLVPPRDLANITNIYNRDFKNWRYYCRKCHMLSDGRLLQINEYNRNRGKLKTRV